jgi:hypothetical protein
MSLIDSHEDMVAWSDRSPLCSTGACPLHVTDVGTGKDRLVAPPVGGAGYLRGGAFAPDGATLAAFVPGASGGSSALLVLIDLTTGRVEGPIPGSEVPVGEPVVAAAWSPTSHWLYFSGLGAWMKAYRPGDGSAIELTRPGSYTFAVS